MKKLYIKTAEKIADDVKEYLLTVSDDYKERYSAYLAARENLVKAVNGERARIALNKMIKLIEERFVHELLRAFFITIAPEEKSSLFMLNEVYMIRNGEITSLRMCVCAGIPLTKNELEIFEMCVEKLRKFYFSETESVIMNFLKDCYKYYC